MSESTADARRDVEVRRERVSETVGEIEAHVAERVDGFKRRTDVGALIRSHPWPALAVALGAGVLLGASGADERAAKATARGTKRAARASVDATKQLAGKLQRRNEEPGDAHMEPELSSSAPTARPGIGARLLTLALAPLASTLDVVLEEMREASRDLGSTLRERASSGASSREARHYEQRQYERRDEGAPAPLGDRELEETLTPVPTTAADVPVPPEMLPSEVDARADVVEALGGGSKEPPIVPGAGDLGARWA